MVQMDKYILSPGDYSSRMDKVALPFNDLHNTVQKPIKGYINTPRTLGDKIRNRRLELKLLQKDVAELIGVSEDAVIYWKNNRSQPQIYLYPGLIKFLGCFPFVTDISTLGGRIKEYRLKKGLSYKKAGELLEVDGATIWAWERNRNIPLKKHLKKLQDLLK
jgi:transcriptional regulator with XRE-family HTH domain